MQSKPKVNWIVVITTLKYGDLRQPPKRMMGPILEMRLATSVMPSQERPIFAVSWSSKWLLPSIS